jgi:hypothetical protein
VRKVLTVVAIVALAALACVGLITLLAGRDSSQVSGTSGPGTLEPDRGSQKLGADSPQTPASPPDKPPTSGSYHAAPVTRDQTELSDDQILTALALGNVVIFYDEGKAPVSVQHDVSGAFDPALAEAGQAVILAKRPGIGDVQALAWRRRFVAKGPDDPRLRPFAEAYLGQGAG